MKKILADIGVGEEVELKQARGVVGRGGMVVEVIVAKLGNIDQKRRVMESKRALWGREERVEDDLTWKERRIKARLRYSGSRRKERKDVKSGIREDMDRRGKVEAG